MRQQEVDPRRTELQQRGIDRDRVISYIDRAEQPCVQVPVPLRAQQADRAEHLVIAAAAIGIPPVPVIRGPVTVDGDANPHAAVSEQVAERLIQQHAVGMNPQIEIAHAS